MILITIVSFFFYLLPHKRTNQRKDGDFFLRYQSLFEHGMLSKLERLHMRPDKNHWNRFTTQI